jgi:hypothetical protein
VVLGVEYIQNLFAELISNHFNGNELHFEANLSDASLKSLYAWCPTSSKLLI